MEDPGDANRRSPEHRKRRSRTALLLVGIISVVFAASHLVHRGGIRVLEKRADEELTYQLRSCHTGVTRTLEQMINVLEALTHQEQMLAIWDGDPDSEIQWALKRLLENSRMFTQLSCLDPQGRVVAATDYEKLSETVELPPRARELLESGRRGHLERTARGFSMTVPIIFEFDQQELLGYVSAESDLVSLLPDDRTQLMRITGPDGGVLAERRGDGYQAWGDEGLEVRTAPIRPPEGIAPPGWSVEVANSNAALALEGRVLKRMVLVLTSGTAAIVVVLVLLFARFEAGLFRRLEARAKELEILNQRLDRSRADLVKAARMAGMSEVATGILHNVGNVLNSLNVAAHQAGETLSRHRIHELRELVDVLDGDASELADAIREHPKGDPFLAYLPALTSSLEADQRRAVEEVECVRDCIDQIKTLVSSQQEYANRSGVSEETQLPEVMEGALVISNQVLGEPAGIEIVRDFEAIPSVTLYKHKVIEILVNVINNARQSLQEAGGVAPVLALGIRCTAPDRAEFRVVDNGLGIPEKNLVKVFHHGFSTKDEAHGFGLHVASNAAEEIGGSLSAQSDGVGRGATFVLEIPFGAAA